MLSKNTILRAKQAVESLYDSTADVFEVKKVKEGSLTKFNSVKIHSGVPCRVSYSSIAPTESSNTTSGLTQVIKLFISPDIVIKPGSKIDVIHLKENIAYKSSGKPAVYPTHQEIMLELWEENA